jgi:DNA repair protein RAD9
LIDSIGDKGFNVKFIDSIDDMSLVYPLDLRIGDHIIVNRSNYVVSGLESSSENDSNEIIRCMRGYDTVLVKRIKKGKAKKESNQEEKFPIGFIKMDTNEWFKKKRVGYDSFTKPRRNIQKEANHIIPTYQEELLMSTPQKMDNATKSNIFACCLFVITGDVQKDELSHLIYSHGGSIIEEGFSSTVYLENSENNEPIVRSKKLLQGFKFAALISNKHARSPKYLETLALGWPLLSTSFIHDSISEGTLKTEFLTTYLLPAGESKRMKFIKSHNIHGFKNNLDLQVDLSKQLSNNRLLNGKHVILTSTNPEIIRFIFYILGAKTVTITTLTNYTNLIHSLSTIAKEDIGDSSVLIYHEKMKTLKSGLESLDSPEKPKSSKKSQLITSDILSNRAPVTLELVDWEWVVQCLIDGSPWPSQTKTI